jgi:hypothetical protein
LRIEFTVTEQQQYRALRALQRRTASYYWSLAFFLGVPALLVVVYLAQGATLSELLLEHGGAILAGPALVFVGFPLLQRWGVRSQYRSSPAMRGVQSYDFGPEAIAMAGPLSSATMQWEAVIKAVETPEFFLLYIAKARAHFVPKSAFGDEGDLNQMRALLQRQLAGRFHGRQRVPAAHVPAA